jgi:predicted nucleotidyltransferase
MQSVARAPIADPSTLLARLRAQEVPLRAAGVAGLFLFGSAARGEAGSASDIDLFIDQADPERFDLFDLMDLRERLGAVLGGVAADLATRSSLHPALRPAIEASALRVF